MNQSVMKKLIKKDFLFGYTRHFRNPKRSAAYINKSGMKRNIFPHNACQFNTRFTDKMVHCFAFVISKQKHLFKRRYNINSSSAHGICFYILCN